MSAVKTVRLACVSVTRAVGSKKLLPEFAEVDNNGVAMMERGTVVFDIKATVGHVYTIEAAKWGASGEEKTIKPSSLRWESQYQDREQRLEWETRASIVRAKAGNEKARAHAEKSTALRETIRPLAKAYQKLIMSDDRRAFLAMVVEEVCNPRNAKET